MPWNFTLAQQRKIMGNALQMPAYQITQELENFFTPKRAATVLKNAKGNFAARLEVLEDLMLALNEAPLRFKSSNVSGMLNNAGGNFIPIVNAISDMVTPVDEDAKQVPFAEAEPGATGLELLLPLVLKWGTEMRLGLAETLAPVTSRAAAIPGSDAGRIAPGAPADLCLFDPRKPWMALPSALASQGKNTPFMGFEMTGRVARTIVGGRSVYAE